MSIEAPVSVSDPLFSGGKNTKMERYSQSRDGIHYDDFVFTGEDGKEEIFKQKYVFPADYVAQEGVEPKTVALDREVLQNQEGSVFTKTPTDIRAHEITNPTYYFEEDKFPHRPDNLNPLLEESVYLVDGYSKRAGDNNTVVPSRLEFLHTKARVAYKKIVGDKRENRRERATEVENYLKAVAIRRNAGTAFAQEVHSVILEQGQYGSVLSDMAVIRNREVIAATPSDKSDVFARMDAVFVRFEGVFGRMFSDETETALAARIAPTSSWWVKQPDSRRTASGEIPLILSKSGTSVIESRVLSDLFMQMAAEEALPGMEGFFADTLSAKGIENVRLIDLLGLQGVGKGTILKTMNRIASELTLNGQFAYEGKPFSTTMTQVLFDSLAANVDTITTGTKGIFNPRGEARYKSHGEGLKKAAAIPVSEGILVNDQIVILETLYEMSKSALVANGSQLIIQGETFPRSGGQAEFYTQTLPQYLKEAGSSKMETQIIYLEMVDTNGKALLEANRALAGKLSAKLGTLLEKVAPKYGQPHHTVDGLVSPTLGRAEAGEQMLNDLAVMLKLELQDNLAELLKDETDPALATSILKTFVEGAASSLGRMAGRYKVEMREDESKGNSVMRRFSDYFKNSVPFVMEMGVEIVPALGNPTEAIEQYLRAKIKQADPGYDFESEEFKFVLKMAQEIHHEHVYGKPLVTQDEP